MTRREVPSDLRLRIRTFMKFRYSGVEPAEEGDEVAAIKHPPRMYSELAIIDELSAGIKRDLLSYMTQTLVEKLPFFAGMDLPPTFATFLSEVRASSASGGEKNMQCSPTPYSPSHLGPA